MLSLSKHLLGSFAALRMMYKFSKSFIVLAIAVLLSGCESSGYAQKLNEKQLTLQTAKGAVTLNVEVADSDEKRAIGLMGRDQLSANTGMWFVFLDFAPRDFWMKNTKIPLDILFFNEKKEIVSMVENMEPCPPADLSCPVYTSNEPAMYALEVNAGFVKEKRIRRGDRINE